MTNSIRKTTKIFLYQEAPCYQAMYGPVYSPEKDNSLIPSGLQTQDLQHDCPMTCDQLLPTPPTHPLFSYNKRNRALRDDCKRQSFKIKVLEQYTY